MSEFQSYAWRTLHRRLTAQEQQAVDKLSSHIEVTPTGAEVTYQWGDFKHDAIQVLVRYFDAFFYFANWGTRRLALRFPRSLIDAAAFSPYLWEEAVELEEHGESYVLTVDLDREYADDWFDGDMSIDNLAQLRDDILRGDYRVLYLAWLHGICRAGGQEMDELDDEVTPPLPAGLGTLSPALEAFCEIFGIDPYLVDVAADASSDLRAPDAGVLSAAIARLSRDECDAYLLRLAQGDMQLAFDFQQRLRKLVGPAESANLPAATLGTWGALRRAAEQHQQVVEAAAQKAAAEQRLKELQALASREPQLWQEVDRLIDAQKGSSYEHAVALLLQLRALAEHEKRLPVFRARIAAIKARQGRRTALIARMQKAGLLSA